MFKKRGSLQQRIQKNVFVKSKAFQEWQSPSYSKPSPHSPLYRFIFLTIMSRDQCFGRSSEIEATHVLAKALLKSFLETFLKYFKDDHYLVSHSELKFKII